MHAKTIDWGLTLQMCVSSVGFPRSRSIRRAGSKCRDVKLRWLYQGKVSSLLSRSVISLFPHPLESRDQQNETMSSLVTMPDEPLRNYGVQILSFGPLKYKMESPGHSPGRQRKTRMEALVQVSDRYMGISSSGPHVEQFPQARFSVAATPF